MAITGMAGTSLSIEPCPRGEMIAERRRGVLSSLLAKLRIELQVANPAHQGWRWRSVKKKTDRVDALKLAQLSAVNQLPLVKVPSKEVREWRSLIHYRQGLVARRTAIKNTIRSILRRQAIDMSSGKRGWTNAHL